MRDRAWGPPLARAGREALTEEVTLRLRLAWRRCGGRARNWERHPRQR